MLGVILSIAVATAPILLVLAASVASPKFRFRWANVFKVYLTLLFGGIGLVGHLIRPEAMLELIPPFFPLRMASVYATGLIELAFAVLIWTRWERLTGWIIIAYLALVLPFNVYGWTVPGNSPNYIDAPYYLWLRVPMQLLFMAFAYFGTHRAFPATETANRPPQIRPTNGGTLLQ